MLAPRERWADIIFTSKGRNLTPKAAAVWPRETKGWAPGCSVLLGMVDHSASDSPNDMGVPSTRSRSPLPGHFCVKEQTSSDLSAGSLPGELILSRGQERAGEGLAERVPDTPP